MRNRLAIPAAAGLLLTAASAQASKTSLSGEYIEARTCSVYTGACHANGEAVTIGREALMAWHIEKGVVEGKKVDGLNVVAVVAGADNLGRKGCDRSSVIYVDSRAGAELRESIVDVLQEKYGCVLGVIKAVKSAPIEFIKKDREYTVRIPGTATVKTTRYACSHCVMPHQVWYQPLVPVKNSLVAMAALNEFKGARELPTSWTRTEENSSYVGEFSF
jgi:hypothetical protein